MIISAAGIKINFEYFPSSKKETKLVFLLHGFTGSSDDWNEIIPLFNKDFSCVAVDLIGHGKSDSPSNIEPYTAESIIQQLDEVFTHFTKDKFILLGYSMGGRAALSYAVKFPEKLASLVLESTSAGISDEKLREERVQSDEKIIKMIEEKSIEDFIEFWMNQDLFSSLKKLLKEKLEVIRNSKFKIQKIGLINSLEGFGTGVMPALHNKLNLIKCKTMLITGELDKKFTQINSELVTSFPFAKHVIIQNAGHNVHLEKPEEFVIIFNNFIEKF